MKHLRGRWARSTSPLRLALGLTLLAVFAGACGDEDPEGTRVRGCTSDCRPGSIELALLGPSIAAYRGDTVVRASRTGLELLDADLETFERVDLDLAPDQRITQLRAQGDALLLRVEDDGCTGACGALWLVGPDFEVRLEVPLAAGYQVAISPGLDLIVRAHEIATAEPAELRATTVDGTPAWTLGHPAIASLALGGFSPDGELIVSGQFSGTLDLGHGTTPLTTAPSQFERFTARISAEGVPRWVRGDELAGRTVFAADGQMFVVSGGTALAVRRVDAEGVVTSTVTSTEGAYVLAPTAALVDATGMVVSGLETAGDGDLFLATVTADSIAFPLRGAQRGDSSLQALGMTERSIFATLAQTYYDCATPDGCGTPSFTVDGVTISGDALVKLHR